MTLFERKRKKALKQATIEQLEEAYERERQKWIKNGYGGDGRISPEMREISDEIDRRKLKEWENDPKRSKDPDFRWTDANRWD